VEVDETYIGGKQRGYKGMRKNKDVVVGIRQRGGDLRLMHVENNTSAELGAQVGKNVSPDVKMIVTDELSAYPSAMISAGIHGSKHETIEHKERVYVRGDVHTNTIESAFSLLKRGIIGSFHQVSIEHLQRYLNEFGYRFNRRVAADIFEQTVSRLTAGKAIPYRKLVERNAFTPFVRP